MVTANAVLRTSAIKSKRAAVRHALRENFNDRMTMKSTVILLSATLLSCLAVTQAMADCQIADAKLEEAILHQENLRGSANRQSVRDLRRLRDAALIL